MQCMLPNSLVKDFNVGNDEAAAYRGISFLVFLSGKLKGAKAFTVDYGILLEKISFSLCPTSRDPTLNKHICLLVCGKDVDKGVDISGFHFQGTCPSNKFFRFFGQGRISRAGGRGADLLHFFQAFSLRVYRQSSFRCRSR